MNELQLKDIFDVDPFDFVFKNSLAPWRGRAAEVAPQIRIDVTEDDKQYLVKADIPGVRKEDIDVRVEGNLVTIGAEVRRDKEEKKGGRVLRAEREYGYASRSFTLASAVDDSKADAKYTNGVLELTLPKKATAASKKLSIS